MQSYRVYSLTQEAGSEGRLVALLKKTKKDVPQLRNGKEPVAFSKITLDNIPNRTTFHASHPSRGASLERSLDVGWVAVAAGRA